MLSLSLSLSNNLKFYYITKKEKKTPNEIMGREEKTSGYQTIDLQNNKKLCRFDQEWITEYD